MTTPRARRIVTVRVMHSGPVRPTEFVIYRAGESRSQPGMTRGDDFGHFEYRRVAGFWTAA